MKKSTNNSKRSKETKKIQVKYFKKERVFNQIDFESLALFREMMADRYRSLHDED